MPPFFILSRTDRVLVLDVGDANLLLFGFWHNDFLDMLSLYSLAHGVLHSNFLGSYPLHCCALHSLTKILMFFILPVAELSGRLTLLSDSHISSHITTHVSSVIRLCPGHSIASLKILGAMAHAAFTTNSS